MIAGSVLPIKSAEDLLATLPGVISARIMASPSGAVEEIHMLTTNDVTPKQTVRNVESALIAHLGMHVSHKKISVAMSDVSESQRQQQKASTPQLQLSSPEAAVAARAKDVTASASTMRRRVYFEDVEVRRSRTKGIACCVTLRKGGETFVGEAEGVDGERMRMELAARATLAAIKKAEGESWVAGLEGCRVVEAFEREFVFVGITIRIGRESALTTGSAEVRESAEMASVLAVLDASNRWLER